MINKYKKILKIYKNQQELLYKVVYNKINNYDKVLSIKYKIYHNNKS